MGRKRHEGSRRKKGGGVMMGLRGGVKNLAKGVVGDDEAQKKPKSKIWTWTSNIVSGALILVALAIFLKRCGVIDW